MRWPSGGTALASLLWGDVDFQSALGVTVYRQNMTTALPIDNISLAGRGYRYLADDSLQLYPFGYGLSLGKSTPPLTRSHGCKLSFQHGQQVRLDWLGPQASGERRSSAARGRAQ